MQQIMENAKKDFTVSHDIAAEFVNRRKRRVKIMAGEIAADEQSDDPDFALKTNVFIQSIDVVLMQPSDRFIEKNCESNARNVFLYSKISVI